MKKQIILEDQHGNPVVMPSKIVVCGACDGEGTQEHPAFENGITSSEWRQMDQDDRHNYMSGAYDVRCECCEGERVVRVIDDEQRMTFAQKRAYVLYRQDQRINAELAAERRAERRMGC